MAVGTVEMTCLPSSGMDLLQLQQPPVQVQLLGQPQGQPELYCMTASPAIPCR